MGCPAVGGRGGGRVFPKRIASVKREKKKKNVHNICCERLSFYRETRKKKKKGEKTLRFHSIQVVRVLIIYSRTIGIITCRRYSPYGRRQGRFIQIVVLSPYDTNEFTVSISNDGKKSRKKKTTNLLCEKMYNYIRITRETYRVAT